MTTKERLAIWYEVLHMMETRKRWVLGSITSENDLHGGVCHWIEDAVKELRYFEKGTKLIRLDCSPWNVYEETGTCSLGDKLYSLEINYPEFYAFRTTASCYFWPKDEEGDACRMYAVQEIISNLKKEIENGICDK